MTWSGTVPLEMLDTGQQSSSGNCLTTSIYLDPANYDGAVFYLEVVALRSSNPCYVQLYDLTNSAALLTDNAGNGIEVYAPGAATRRIRSGAFTPAAGKNKLCLKFSAVCLIYTARIIVVQTNATKTRVQIPMFAEKHDAYGTMDAYFVEARAATSYAQTTPMKYTWFPKTAGAFAALSGNCWTFEAVLANADAGATSYATLYNVTDSATITGAEVSKAGTAIDVVDVSIADDAGNWHDGDRHEVYIKSSSASYAARLLAARLYVTLTSITALDVYHRISKASSATAAQSMMSARGLFPLNSYSPAPGGVYYQLAGYCATNAAGPYLCSDTTNDVGVTGWADVDSKNWNSATKALYRSADLSLTDSRRYVSRTAATAGTDQIGPGFIVVACVGAATGCPKMTDHYARLRRG